MLNFYNILEDFLNNTELNPYNGDCKKITNEIKKICPSDIEIIEIKHFEDEYACKHTSIEFFDKKIKDYDYLDYCWG